MNDGLEDDSECIEVGDWKDEMLIVEMIELLVDDIPTFCSRPILLIPMELMVYTLVYEHSRVRSF